MSTATFQHCHTLPPRMRGIARGHLFMKVEGIKWDGDSIEDVQVRVNWYGESKTSIFRPACLTSTSPDPKGPTLIFPIRTTIENFNIYLKEIKCLEMDVIRDPVGCGDATLQVLGHIKIHDIFSIVNSSCPKPSCVPVLNLTGTKIGTVQIDFKVKYPFNSEASVSVSSETSQKKQSIGSSKGLSGQRSCFEKSVFTYSVKDPVSADKLDSHKGQITDTCVSELLVQSHLLRETIIKSAAEISSCQAKGLLQDDIALMDAGAESSSKEAKSLHEKELSMVSPCIEISSDQTKSAGLKVGLLGILEADVVTSSVQDKSMPAEDLSAIVETSNVVEHSRVDDVVECFSDLAVSSPEKKLTTDASIVSNKLSPIKPSSVKRARVSYRTPRTKAVGLLLSPQMDGNELKSPSGVLGVSSSDGCVTICSPPKPPSSSVDTAHNLVLLDYVNCVKVTVGWLKLNECGVKKVCAAHDPPAEGTAQVIPCGATFLVKFEVPGNLLTAKQTLCRQSAPFVSQLKCFASTLVDSDSAQFNQSSVHIIVPGSGQSRKLSDTIVEFHVLCRLLDQNVPSNVGRAHFQVSDLLVAPHLSRTAEVPVISTGRRQKTKTALGQLSVTIQLGLNNEYFGVKLSTFLEEHYHPRAMAPRPRKRNKDGTDEESLFEAVCRMSQTVAVPPKSPVQKPLTLSELATDDAVPAQDKTIQDPTPIVVVALLTDTPVGPQALSLEDLAAEDEKTVEDIAQEISSAPVGEGATPVQQESLLGGDARSAVRLQEAKDVAPITIVADGPNETNEGASSVTGGQKTVPPVLPTIVAGTKLRGVEATPPVTVAVKKPGEVEVLAPVTIERGATNEAADLVAEEVGSIKSSLASVTISGGGESNVEKRVVASGTTETRVTQAVAGTQTDPPRRRPATTRATQTVGPRHDSEATPVRTVASLGVHGQRLQTFRARVEVEKAMHLPNHAAGRHVSTHSTYWASFQAESRIVCDPSSSVCTPRVTVAEDKTVWNWYTSVDFPATLLSDATQRFVIRVVQSFEPRNPAKHSGLLPDVTIGHAAVDLTVLLSGCSWISGWFNIVDQIGCCNGQIKLNITPLDNLPLFSDPPVFAITTGGPQEPPRGSRAAAGTVAAGLAVKVQMPEELPPPVEDEELPGPNSLADALQGKLAEMDIITVRLKQRLETVTNDDSNLLEGRFLVECDDSHAHSGSHKCSQLPCSTQSLAPRVANYSSQCVLDGATLKGDAHDKLAFEEHYLANDTNSHATNGCGDQSGCLNCDLTSDDDNVTEFDALTDYLSSAQDISLENVLNPILLQNVLASTVVGEVNGNEGAVQRYTLEEDEEAVQVYVPIVEVGMQGEGEQQESEVNAEKDDFTSGEDSTRQAPDGGNAEVKDGSGPDAAGNHTPQPAAPARDESDDGYSPSIPSLEEEEVDKPVVRAVATAAVALATEDPEAGILVEAVVPVTEDPEAGIQEEAVVPATEDPEAGIQEEAVVPATEDPEAGIQEEAVVPATEDPEAGIQEEAVVPATEDPEAGIQEKAVAPATEDPEAGIQEEVVAPAPEDPEMGVNEAPVITGREDEAAQTSVAAAGCAWPPQGRVAEPQVALELNTGEVHRLAMLFDPTRVGPKLH